MQKIFALFTRVHWLSGSVIEVNLKAIAIQRRAVQYWAKRVSSTAHRKLFECDLERQTCNHIEVERTGYAGSKTDEVTQPVNGSLRCSGLFLPVILSRITPTLP